MRPLFIGGATGSGKSSIALALAEKTAGEIVNADAYQLYRGLEIVSAAPTADEQLRVPHHLFACLDPEAECNAARYAAMASDAIGEILARARLPIVVGGSGLYLKSLTHGLSDLPPADPDLRAELESLSLEQLAGKLRELDPTGADQVDPQNRRYLTRAVEISILAGKPVSELKREWREGRSDFDGVLIERPRDQLYARINARVPKMVSAGLFDEIRSLPRSTSATAEKAIGVPEVRRYLAGEGSQAECIAAIQQSSRRYAKRQCTWFRRETGFQSICLDEDETPESAADRVLKLFPSHHR